MNVLWIVNKYVKVNDYEYFYFYFLHYVKLELLKNNIEINYITFSDNISDSPFSNEILFYEDYTNIDSHNISEIALELEHKYKFTFKQSYFSDLLQTLKSRREIDVPEDKFNKLSELVPKFLYLENLISNNKYDIIFSDVSPEVEMEFARILGNYYGVKVIKDNEGAFLGRSIFNKLLNFGEEELIEVDLGNGMPKENISYFIDNFIKNKDKPYLKRVFTTDNLTFKKKFLNLVRYNNLYSFLYGKLISFLHKIEHDIIKNFFIDKFDKSQNYFFLGLHLNQESTMSLRAQPFTNQVVLAEMLSRVLPANYLLYVREHPHWPETYKLSYLLKFRKLNNVRLISCDIPIHDIIEHSKGLLTYNATTTIESLMYGKPVLTFSSNIYYKYHAEVDYCNNMYDLGEKLTQLLFKSISKDETINYMFKLFNYSHVISLSSYSFLSIDDAYQKASLFSNYLKRVFLHVLNE